MGMHILDRDDDLTHIAFSGRLDTTVVERIAGWPHAHAMRQTSGRVC